MSDNGFMLEWKRNRNGKTSFDMVKEFIQLKREGLAKDEDIKLVEDEVYNLLARLERVKTIGGEFANIELGEDVIELVKALDRKKVVRMFPLFARAASFL